MKRYIVKYMGPADRAQIDGIFIERGHSRVLELSAGQVRTLRSLARHLFDVSPVFNPNPYPTQTAPAADNEEVTE